MSPLLHLCLALAVAIGSTTSPAALRFDPPAGWMSKTPSSAMRVAEFALARAEGDTEDATVTVFFFGGQGGSVQANLDRWVGQFAQPDGRSSKDVAVTSTERVHGLDVTLVDVSGTYVAEMSPGAAAHFNKPGFRQVAAVVQTPGGPYFLKFLGPQRTVERWLGSFRDFVKSVRYE